MSKKEIGFYALAAGAAIHVYGNAKKFYNNSTANVKNSTTDWVYYAATLALVIGVGLVWREITPR